MRKTTICLLMVFCSMGIVLGQSQPQWKVVKTVVLKYQSTPIPPTTIFTAKTPGLYRLGAYMGGGGKGMGGGLWSLTLAWNDLHKVPANLGPQCSYNKSGCWGELSPVLFVPEPQVPVTYEVRCIQGTCSDFMYRIAITVEQLQ